VGDGGFAKLITVERVGLADARRLDGFDCGDFVGMCHLLDALYWHRCAKRAKLWNVQNPQKRRRCPRWRFLLRDAFFVGCVQPVDVPAAHSSRKLDRGRYLAALYHPVNCDATASISCGYLLGI